MIRTTIFTLAAGLLTGLTIPVVASASTSSLPLPASVSHPCKEEDSVNCYWNAGSAGNHQGHSFITRQMPKQGKQKRGTICVIYIAKADGHWDYCY
jgi:hypothetical protein